VAGAPHRRIGEVLVERGVLAGEQVRRVLRVQLQRLPAEGHVLFGRIAVARRYTSAEAVSRALDEQSRDILAGGAVRRIGDILLAADELGAREVEAILAYQAKADPVPLAEASRAGTGGETAAGRGVERRAFLPRGALGFVSSHSTWIIACAAAALALALVLLRDLIFRA
jgi:hypothetical protein